MFIKYCKMCFLKSSGEICGSEPGWLLCWRCTHCKTWLSLFWNRYIYPKVDHKASIEVWREVHCRSQQAGQEKKEKKMFLCQFMIFKKHKLGSLLEEETSWRKRKVVNEGMLTTWERGTEEYKTTGRSDLFPQTDQRNWSSSSRFISFTSNSEKKWTTFL